MTDDLTRRLAQAATTALAERDGWECWDDLSEIGRADALAFTRAILAALLREPEIATVRKCINRCIGDDREFITHFAQDGWQAHATKVQLHEEVAALAWLAGLGGGGGRGDAVDNDADTGGCHACKDSDHDSRIPR